MPEGPVTAVTDDELREVVSNYWVIDEITPAHIHGHPPPENLPFRFAGLRDEPSGRKSVPTWLLSAHFVLIGHTPGAMATDRCWVNSDYFVRGSV